MIGAPQSGASPRRPRVALTFAVAFVAMAGHLTAAAQQRCSSALEQRNLLEPERAFALSARGLDPKTVEVRFDVADGYYLYRDKLKLNVERAALVAPPPLPQGKMKHDDFFGDVETYRGTVTVQLALDKPAPGSAIDVVAESQGCADAGICYPAQRQRLTLTLPAQGAGPGALVEATPAKRSWFK